MSPASRRFPALSTTRELSPSFLDISKALDFPGRPIVSLYVGLNVSTSNSMEAFSTPFVLMANFFSSV